MRNKTVYGFDNVGGLPVMAVHSFSLLNNGHLLHEIDGKIRAEVPPEGFEAYVASWPEAGDVCASIREVSGGEIISEPLAALAEAVNANPADDAEQIAILKQQLANLEAKQDNSPVGSPSDTVSLSPEASPGV